MNSSENRRPLTRSERGAIVKTFECAVATSVEDIIDTVVLPRVNLITKATKAIVGKCYSEGVYTKRVEYDAGHSYLRKGYEDVVQFIYPHVTSRDVNAKEFVASEQTIAAIAALSQRSTDELNALLRFSGSAEIHECDEQGAPIALTRPGESGRTCPYGALPSNMSKPLFKEFCKHAGALLVASRDAPYINVAAVPKVIYNYPYGR